MNIPKLGSLVISTVFRLRSHVNLKGGSQQVKECRGVNRCGSQIFSSYLFLPGQVGFFTVPHFFFFFGGGGVFFDHDPS